MNRTLSLVWAATAISLTSALGAQSTGGFGTSGKVPFQLKGSIYYMDSTESSLPDFTKLKPVGVISTTVLDIPIQSFEVGFPGVTDRFEWFAINYQGSFMISDAGRYTFSLESDDGSKLFIDGAEVINNDGIHGVTSVDTTLKLSEGPHDITVQYFQGPRTEVALRLLFAPEGQTLEPMDFAKLAPSAITRSGNKLHAALGGAVLFDTNSSVLRPKAIAVLKDLKEGMIDPYPGSPILIEGHTDDVGSDAANQVLSEERAKAVVKWLTDNGIAASRLKSAGLGETHPQVPNNSDANRAKNRRIEVTVTLP